MTEMHIPEMHRREGAIFLTVGETDRIGIATSIERLIDLLDAMEPDPDLEPWLGSGDDREDTCEDEGAQCEGGGEATGDEEHSLGWQDEGAQLTLEGGFGEYEADLGTTEEIDQVRRLEQAPGWVADTEPDLGWAETHGRGITGKGQNCLDDREHEDEREPEETDQNGDEADYAFNSEDEAQSHQWHNDPSMTFEGAGDVSQRQDGWRPAPGSAVAPVMQERAKRRANGVVHRDYRHAVPLIPPDTAGLIPEIALRRFME